MSGSFPYLRWRWQLESKSFLPQRDNLWFPQRWKCLIFKPLQNKVYFFANHVLPVLPCDDSELQTMETMHTYTPVFTVKLLSGECSQEEVHKLTLNLCQHAVQTNHLAKRLWRTNQHKLSGRRYLDLKDWTHRVRSGDCGNRLAAVLTCLGKPHNVSHTAKQTHKDNYTWLNPSTLTEIHTLVSMNSFIGCTHFTHNCMRAVISINKHVVMQNTSYKLANVH